jgi:hypothetical protein
MRVQSISLAGLALLLSAGVAHCQEKYTIVVKELGAGDSARFERNGTGIFKFSFANEQAKSTPKEDEQKFAKHFVFTETVLARPDLEKMPTKLRRTYETAKVTKDGQEDKKEPFVLPYQGKTILIEKKGDEYGFTTESGEQINEDPELWGEFNSPDFDLPKRLFLPSEAVGVGQTWKFDPKPLITAGKDGKIDIVKSDGVAKLVKVNRKDGKLFGTINAETHVEFHITLAPGAPGPVKSADKTLMKLTFEGCIDGSVAEGRIIGSTEFTNSATFSANDMFPNGKATSTGVSKVEVSWRQLPPN